MNNESFVLNSEEKYKSHELINSKFWPWIDVHFDTPGYIITMPSRSGRQENMILEYILKSERSKSSKLRLLTFDDTYEASGTGIKLEHPHRLWQHQKCGDIFKSLINKNYAEAPTAAWFDLTGGLLNQRIVMLQTIISRMFGHGSLFFITLGIEHVRGLSHEHYIRAVYDYTGSSRAAATEATLIRLVEKLGNKYMVPCCAPYVYKHGKTTYGVFGYLIGKH